MIFALLMALAVLLGVGGFLCLGLWLSLLRPASAEAPPSSVDPWARFRNVLRYRAPGGARYRRCRADIRLSLTTTAAILIAAIAVLLTPLVYLDAAGHLSPADKQLVSSVPVQWVVLLVIGICIVDLGYVAYIYAKRCSIKPRLGALMRIATELLRSRTWVIVSAVLLVLSVAIVGRVAFYQLFEDPDAHAELWIDSAVGTVKGTPVLDVVQQFDSLLFDVTFHGQHGGVVRLQMDHIADPSACKLVSGDSPSTTPAMQLDGGTVRGGVVTRRSYETYVTVPPNVFVTLQCPMDGIEQEPSGARRRLMIQTVWTRKAYVKPEPSEIALLEHLGQNHALAVASASTGFAGQQSVHLGSVMLDGEDVSIRTVQQPALDMLMTHDPKLPPFFVIDWQDPGAQVVEELGVLASGAIIALALTMLIEAFRRDIDAMQDAE